MEEKIQNTVGKKKRILRWATLLLLIAIILYGTYELLG